MKHALVLLALVSATLVPGGCTGGGAARSNAMPAVAASAVPSRGCYDHKGRIERTVTTEAECHVQDWVWKP